MAKHKLTFEYEIDVEDEQWISIETQSSLDGEQLYKSGANFRYLVQVIDDARFHADNTIQLLKHAVMEDTGDRCSWPTCNNTLITGEECSRPVAHNLIDQTNDAFLLCTECADDLQIEA